MMNRAAVVGTLIAGLCLAVPGTVRAQQDILKAGGVDDAAVAIAYYETIDPNDERLTQDAWEQVNGFNDPMNQVIVAKGYFNNGDLSFFRSIEMVRDQRPGYRGNIAFTTVNYATEADALAEVNKVSIVNMEYSPGPDGDRIVKFYVFSPDGARQLSTTFDRRGEELYLPAACFSCHGGTDDATSPLPPGGYNGGSGETGAAFLAFDINTMTFSDDVPAGQPGGCLQGVQQGRAPDQPDERDPNTHQWSLWWLGASQRHPSRLPARELGRRGAALPTGRRPLVPTLPHGRRFEGPQPGVGEVEHLGDQGRGVPRAEDAKLTPESRTVLGR